MSYVGNTIHVALALLVALSSVGLVGTTVYYEESVDQLRQENSELSDRNAELEASLQRERQRIDRLNATLQRVNQTLQTRLSDIEEVSEQLRATEARLNATRGELNATERDLNRSQEQVAALREEVSELEVERDRLQNDLESARQLAADLNETIVRLEERSASQNRTMEQLNGTIDRLETRSDRQNRTMERLNETIDQQQRMLDRKNRTIRDLRDRIDRLEERVEELEDSSSQDYARPDRHPRSRSLAARGGTTMTDDSPHDAMGAALAEIRRERLKAAFVYASVDAVCAMLAANLLASVVDLSLLDTGIAASSFESVGLPAPDAGTLVGTGAGLVVLVAEMAVRTRRPAAEAFEAANPEVREALRTARDAATDDRSNPMKRALYADVLDRLRETSSVSLLNATRLALTVAVAFALSLATVQTAVVGVDVGLSDSDPAATGPAEVVDDQRAFSDRTEDLQDGDEVLGDPTNVSAGSENLSAAVSANPGGEGERDWDYDSDAGDDGEDESVDAQRAGFTSPDRVEDATLVQRYARELGTNSTDSYSTDG
ncbi:DUF7502 family protein [Halorussus litoreus]|uniref:DUF7502 family protein n=1 Tax=Halorussus litoreus TaxID=1710536 RepID=UPI000E270A98|nr:hypothetical protein [Halorussus litoreus]